MGINHSGTVAFGVEVTDELLPFPWPPELQEEIEHHEDVDPSALGEYLARRKGIVNPLDNPGPGYDEEEGWPEGQEPSDWKGRCDLWSSACTKAESDAPIEILRWGHYEDSTLYIVALKGTEVSTYDCSETKELVLPTIDQSRIEEAAEFCRANEICPFEESSWLLGSSVG
jgi:hypothetical protein